MQDFYNNQEGKRACKLEDGDLFSDFEAEAHKIDEEGRNFASKQEVIDAIKELAAQKPNLGISLGKFAHDYIFRKTGKFEIDGNYGDDIVQIVFEKILKQIRKWYKDKVKTIEALIYMAIISEVRNRVKTNNKPNENKLSVEEETADSKKQKKKKTKPKIISLYNADSEGNIIENNIVDFEKAKDFSEDDFYNDAQKGFEELIEEVEEKLEKKADKDDGLSYYVFLERLEGNHSNKNITEKYGVKKNKIVNAYKIVKRVIKDIIKDKK